MYISQIRLHNYRGFSDATIQFNPGINVIIGENNAGKTAILCALRQVFSRDVGRKLDLYDVYQGIGDFSKAPIVEIAVTLTSSDADTEADRALVAQWMTDLEAERWKATLTYQFYLPEDAQKGFIDSLGEAPDTERFYKAVEEHLPKFIGRVYGGHVDDRLPADSELLRKFGCQFLDALRDAESELTSGKNQLLKEMLRDALDKSDSAKNAEFADGVGQIKANVTGRIQSDRLFQLIGETDAADGGELLFEGNLSEAEFLAALELYISRHGISLPINRNGLGYNNLVYISLVLAKLDADATEEKQGQNTIVFPMLLMEEPEAHLHPALQYRLLRYLRSRLGTQGKTRQAFITTHSTQITSACSLDEVICMTGSTEGHQPNVAYPGKVFGESAEGLESKKYVERYLDATKSSMLFARAVIFVEGMAEMLLLPQLAEVIQNSLEEHLVSLISVDGSTFKHFVPLFGACDEGLKEFALTRRVSCLPDADPCSKPAEPKSKWKSCYPYQLHNSDTLEYRPISPVIMNLEQRVSGAENIRIMHGQKTLEYDLALANPFNRTLITDACKGREILLGLCSDPATPPPILSDALEASFALIENEEERSAAKFATLYLMSIEHSKGGAALALAANIKEALASEDSPLTVPGHIASAIRWACVGRPA
jgi:putative ATP-dependent endonuclease of OLD family